MVYSAQFGCYSIFKLRVFLSRLLIATCTVAVFQTSSCNNAQHPSLLIATCTVAVFQTSSFNNAQHPSLPL
jgi:hypothetical protein